MDGGKHVLVCLFVVDVVVVVAFFLTRSYFQRIIKQ